jgi:hypothetical protein
MKRFFFDLVGDIRAHDFMGHECSSKREAKKHASFIARRIGTERPSFAKPGNVIAVRDERGAKISRGANHFDRPASLGNPRPRRGLWPRSTG